MRTFIVLIPVEGNCDARKQCEDIENLKVEKNGSVQKTALDIKKAVIEFINDDTYPLDNIEVEPLTDFMDRVNNQEFNPDDYFMSYVHG